MRYVLTVHYSQSSIDKAQLARNTVLNRRFTTSLISVGSAKHRKLPKDAKTAENHTENNRTLPKTNS